MAEANRCGNTSVKMKICFAQSDSNADECRRVGQRPPGLKPATILLAFVRGLKTPASLRIGFSAVCKVVPCYKARNEMAFQYPIK